MCFILVMKNVIISKCILCITYGKSVFVRVVNEGDVRIFEWVTLLVFNHETTVQSRSRIVRRDTENTIRNGHGFGIENGRVTTQSKVTQEFSFGGGYDICTIRCEIDG